jgi:hypothetical protein
MDVEQIKELAMDINRIQAMAYQNGKAAALQEHRECHAEHCEVDSNIKDPPMSHKDIKTMILDIVNGQYGYNLSCDGVCDGRHEFEFVDSDCSIRKFRVIVEAEDCE